jgi:hypothetical protein
MVASSILAEPTRCSAVHSAREARGAAGGCVRLIARAMSNAELARLTSEASA